MHRRWLAMFGLVVAFLGFTFSGTAALATSPVELDPGYVTDRVGALSEQKRAAVNADLQAIASEGKGSLFLVFVDDFTSPTDYRAWADATAEQNQLGDNQYLLAVATEGRLFYTSYNAAGPLTDEQLDEFESGLMASLSNSDWEGTADAAVLGFRDVLTNAAAGGGSLGVAPLIGGGLVVVGGGAAIAYAVSRKRKGQRQGAGAPGVPNATNDPYATVSTADLRKEAGTALLEADNALTASKEELGFAVAQFGDGASATFAKVIDEAKAKVSQAFSLQQKLDDEVADTEEQQRRWLVEIIDLCDEADALLHSNAAAFEELRKLEKDAPGALARVQAARAAAQGAVDKAPAALESLRALYVPAALTTVIDNPAQAADRLVLADNEIAEATAEVAAQQAGEAAMSIRTAEQAVQQAVQLSAAITALGSSLAEIEQQAKAAIADLEADIAAAEKLPDTQGQLASVVASTRTKLSQAASELAASTRDPQRTLDTLAAANTDIDAILGQARTTAQQAQRAQQQLAPLLSQANARISAVSEYIAARRGAVGTTARTRLAEAGAALHQAIALQNSDPAGALSLAQRANSLAEEASSYAQQEVGGFGGSAGGILGDILGGAMSGGFPQRGYYRQDNDGGLLGGILGGLFSSGGGGGGGSWRSSARSPRTSGFGGSTRSFGGGGRSARSGGGRF